MKIFWIMRIADGEGGVVDSACTRAAALERMKEIHAKENADYCVTDARGVVLETIFAKE